MSSSNRNIPSDYEPAPPVQNNFTAPAHSHLSGEQRQDIVELAESSHRDIEGGRSGLGSEEYTRGDTTRSGNTGYSSGSTGYSRGTTSGLSGVTSGLTSGTSGHHSGSSGLGHSGDSATRGLTSSLEHGRSSHSTSSGTGLAHGGSGTSHGTSGTGTQGLGSIDTTGHKSSSDDRSLGTKIKEAILPGQGSHSDAGAGIGSDRRVGDYSSTTGTSESTSRTGDAGHYGGGISSGEYGNTNRTGDGIGSGTYESAGRGHTGAGLAGAGAGAGLAGAGLASHHQHHSGATSGYEQTSTTSGLGNTSASSYGAGANVAGSGPGIQSGSSGMYETGGTRSGDGLTGSTATSSLGQSHGIGSAAAGGGALAAGGAGAYGASQYGSGSDNYSSGTGSQSGLSGMQGGGISGRKAELEEKAQRGEHATSGNKLADELARNAAKASTTARGFGTKGSGL